MLLREDLNFSQTIGCDEKFVPRVVGGTLVDLIAFFPISNLLALFLVAHLIAFFPISNLLALFLVANLIPNLPLEIALLHLGTTFGGNQTPREKVNYQI